MNKLNKIKLPVIIIALSLLSLSCYNSQQPSAVKGILDLRSWDLKKNGPVQLKGEWIFYWKHFIKNREDLSRTNKTGFFIMPGLWNGLRIHGEEIEGSGYATLGLTVLLKKDSGLLAIKIGEIKSAYQIFVNDKLIGSTGIIGKDIKTSVPGWDPQVIKIKDNSEKLEILLNISNFHYHKGGPHRALEIGLEKDINNQQDKNLILEIFLFGSLFIMALYHLILYFSNRSDLTPLYFGLFCLLISIYLISTGEILMNRLLPGLSWKILVKTVFLSIYISVPFFLLYLDSMYPKKLSKKFLKSVLIVIVLFSIIILLTPVRIFSYTQEIFQLIVVLSSIYTLYILFTSIKKGRWGAVILTIGASILFLSVLNDILYHVEILNTGDMTPFGVFFLILSHGYVISGRSIKKAQNRQGHEDSKITQETEKNIKIIIKYIEEHYTETLSREGLSSKINMHPDNFGRNFKKYTGEKFGDMINKLRVSQSMKALMNTETTILEIALSVGFENLRTFNRIFLKTTGLSPGAYRKKHRK